MFERFAIGLYKLDRWQETSSTIARLRRWILAKHKSYWAKRFKAIQACIRDLQGLNAQILMSGNVKRKLPKVAKRYNKIARMVQRFDGCCNDRSQLKYELATLQKVCTGVADPDTRTAPCKFTQSMA